MMPTSSRPRRGKDKTIRPKPISGGNCVLRRDPSIANYSEGGREGEDQRLRGVTFEMSLQPACLKEPTRVVELTEGVDLAR